MLNFPEYILLLPAVVISIWVAWSDMKFMRIPNIACLWLFGSFLVLGFLVYPLPEYGIRIIQGLVILTIGFLATSFGFLGGGDSKFAAAMAPFIIYHHFIFFLFVLGIVSFVSIGLHKIIGITPGVKKLIVGWDSWEAHGMFPFGVSLAASLVTYMVLNTVYS